MTPEVGESEMAELLAEVRRIDVQSRYLVTDLMSGGYSSVFRGSGVEFEDVREYVEGDDPRRVDWSVTARMGRPFVRTYVEERERTILFALDTSESMDGGFGAWSPRQIAARICGCLALSATRHHDKVGLVAFGRDVVYVPAKKGVGHTLRIVRDCLALRGEGERSDVATALSFTARVVRRRAVVFLVSDFLADPDAWRDGLAACARRHDVVAVRVLACSPPADAGLVRMVDPETGRERVVDWTSRRVRRAYSDGVSRARERSAEALLRAKVDVMDVPIPLERDADAIARPILAFFRMRECRGEKR
jgi:uncharacterized protein (DUF58 family)